MYLIVGLGNPGEDYKHTRHNVGFDIIDLLAQKYNIDLNREKFKGIYGEGNIKNQKVILLKPMTYMNLSGESIREVKKFYKIPEQNIIVIYDDVCIETGKMRIRTKGSAGGHNGIKSIIVNISTDVFPRIKVGVGQPGKDMIKHVLGKFDKEERQIVEKTFEGVVAALEVMLETTAEQAMNKYNGFTAQ